MDKKMLEEKDLEQLKEELRKERELNRELEERLSYKENELLLAESRGYNNGFKDGVKAITYVVKRLV